MSTFPTMSLPPSPGLGLSAPEVSTALQMGLTVQEVADLAETPYGTMRHYLARTGLKPRRGRPRGRHSTRDQNRKWISISQDDPYYGMSHAGWITEHRYVMAKHLGRMLDSTETVHHLNGDPHDNRVGNLQLRQGNHGAGQAWQCCECGSHNVQAVVL